MIINLSSLEKVFPGEKPQAEKLNEFSMFANERYSFQTAFYAESVEYTAEVKSDLASAVKFYLVKCIPNNRDETDLDENVLEGGKKGLYPDLLMPVTDKINVEKGTWNSLWIEICPDGEFGGGIYDIEIILKGACGKALNTAIKCEIIGESLPPQELICTHWFHCDCLATWYDVPVFSERHWETIENYMKTAAEHGINFILTPLFTPPLDTAIGSERPTVQLCDIIQDSDSYIFNFEKLNRWIDTAERCGIKYFEMSHLFTQWGAMFTPKIAATVNNKEKTIFGWDVKSSSVKYRRFLAEFAPSLTKFLKEKGVAERCYFHTSDEPASESVRSYKRAAGLVAEFFPGFKTIDALSDYKYYKKGLVKLPIPSITEADKFYGKVEDFWTYYCCGPKAGNYINRFLFMPSHRNRVLGFMLYKTNAAGFLHWGYNFWYSQLSTGYINPFEDTNANNAFPSGDGFVVYPGENGEPLCSIRLKVFYDGIQDIMALKLLENKIGREKVMGILESGLAKPLWFNEYPHSNEWLKKKREEINGLIKAQ